MSSWQTSLEDLRVFGDPAPQGSKKLIPTRQGPRMLESSGPRLKAWRKAVSAAARESWQGRDPLEGPIKLELLFFLRRPKTSKLLKPISRPDLDKLIRGVGDALTVDAGILGDDSRIVDLRARKEWASEISPPGLILSLSELLEEALA